MIDDPDLVATDGEAHGLETDDELEVEIEGPVSSDVENRKPAVGSIDREQLRAVGRESHGMNVSGLEVREVFGERRCGHDGARRDGPCEHGSGDERSCPQTTRHQGSPENRGKDEAGGEPSVRPTDGATRGGPSSRRSPNLVAGRA